MLLLLLCAAFARDLVLSNESLEGAKLIETEVHSEFVRYHFQLIGEKEDILWVEIQPKSKAGSGACSARGYTISPRWELLSRSLSREQQPTFIKELCARLKNPDYSIPEFGPSIGLVHSTKETQEPFDVVRYRFLFGGLAVWGGLFFLLVRAVRFLRSSQLLVEALGLLGLSFLVRSLFSQFYLFNGAQAGYEKLLDSVGGGHPLYGSGVVWVLNPLYGLLGTQVQMLLDC